MKWTPTDYATRFGHLCPSFMYFYARHHASFSVSNTLNFSVIFSIINIFSSAGVWKILIIPWISYFLILYQFQSELLRVLWLLLILQSTLYFTIFKPLCQGPTMFQDIIFILFELYKILERRNILFSSLLQLSPGYASSFKNPRECRNSWQHSLLFSLILSFQHCFLTII